LSCRYAAEIPIVRSSDHSIVRPFVHPNNLFLPLCCRNSDRSFVHSIVHRSFIVPIHRSSFVHSPYSSFFQIIFVLPLCCRNSDRSFVRSFIVPIHRSFIRLFAITIHRYYSSLLFTDTIHHRYYSVLLFIIVTIHRRYYSSMISSNFFVVTIHRYYSSISRSPQISTSHASCCPVHLRPARPIFQSYKLRWL
jgi:hypothetical protein